MNRLSPIYSSRDPAAVMNELTRLHDTFKRTAKRALPASLLSFSSWGEARRTEYGISLYWEDAEAAEAQWVRENVTKVSP